MSHGIFIPMTTETTPVTMQLNITESSLLLARLNRERAIYFLPAIMWIAVLMLIGTIGNSLVIYVYGRRFKHTSSNYFILTMAVFDLVVCLIAMPTEIYDLLKPFTFYNEIGCKVFRSAENFAIYGSVVVLIEIAFDRYIKICWPLKIVSLQKIKILCLVSVVCAFAMATPSFILYGITRGETPVSGLRGYDCSISDTYRQSVFQTAYFFCLTVVFIATLIFLVGIYVRIWLELRRRKSIVINDQSCLRGENTDGGNAFGRNKGDHSRYCRSDNEDETVLSRNNSAIQLSKINVSIYSPNSTADRQENCRKDSQQSTTNSSRTCLSALAGNALRLRVSRTTIVLFAVTAAFVLSFMPAIAVMMVRTVVKDFEKNQSLASLAVTKIFLKFNFINNAINPIIYSFLNVQFRQQADNVVNRMLQCCCCPNYRYRMRSKQSGSERSTKREFLNV